MTKRARRSFSPKFKAQAVELVRITGKSVTRIAKDLPPSPRISKELDRSGAYGGSEEAVSQYQYEI